MIMRKETEPTKIENFFHRKLETIGCYHIKPDASGLYNGLIVPRSHANIIWMAAWLSFISGWFALYKGYNHLAPVPFGVWFTSILYWSHPTYGWRRNVDMAWVATALLYQCYCAMGAENAVAYFVVMFLAVISYPLGNHCYKTNSWLGIIGHAFIHILGNVGNIILYSGKTKSLQRI